MTPEMPPPGRPPARPAPTRRQVVSSMTADELQQVRTSLIVAMQACEDPFTVKLLAAELREWDALAPAAGK